MIYRCECRHPREKSFLAPPRRELATVIAEGMLEVERGATFVAILRDSEGEDHPDNAEKFFLHQYIKP